MPSDAFQDFPSEENTYQNAPGQETWGADPFAASEIAPLAITNDPWASMTTPQPPADDLGRFAIFSLRKTFLSLTI